MSRLTIFAALCLAGCTQTASQPDASNSQPATAEPAAATPVPTESAPGDPSRVPAELVPASQLVGEWRVAGVDGQDINQPYAITASITATRIHVTADCINLAWDYAAESGAFSAKRVAVEGCGRGLTQAEAAIAATIDGATGFGRVPSNAMEIFSQQHRVTLFSQ